MIDPVVDAIQLTRRFGDVVAVDHLSLSVHPGEVFGILGHNGAGKTTLLRLINGLLTPSSGEVHVFGQQAYASASNNRSRTGVVTESTALDDFLTIRESLVAYGTMCGVPRSRIGDRVETLLASFGLEDVADRQAREASAGMRQRAAMARGLVHEPELLLLDEPTSNLDPVAARQVRERVTAMAREAGRTVLLSTHNLAEAEQVCDRIAVLRHGQLQAIGTMADLRALVGRRAGTISVRIGEGMCSAALQTLQPFGRATSDAITDVLEVSMTHPQDVPRLVRALVEAGVPVHRVHEVEPTLEDVYLALHDGRGDW